MTADGFDPALAFVLKWEGGLSDNPDDPGGRTNRGIMQSEYDIWREHQGLATQDVALIEDQEVAAIYRSDYWMSAHCDALPSGEDLLQFDTAVNMGPVRAIRMLQATVGVTVDGVFGAQTLQAVVASEYPAIVSGYCDRRENYYRALVLRNPELTKFLQGWLDRLNSLRAQIGVPAATGAQRFPEVIPAPTPKIPDYGGNPEFDF